MQRPTGSPLPLLLLLVAGCGTDAVAPPGGDDTDAIIPSNLALEVTLQGEQVNGYGDGSGTVVLRATGTNVSLFRFRLGDEGTEDSASGELTHTFAEDGTNAHRITVVINLQAPEELSALQDQILALLHSPAGASSSVGNGQGGSWGWTGGERGH